MLQKRLLVLSICAICLLTLFPVTAKAPIDPFYLGIEGRRGIADVGVNVLLFFPVGFLLRLNGARWLAALIAAAALSLSIELTQLLVPGRYPGARDLIVNIVGAASGYVCAVLLRRHRPG